MVLKLLDSPQRRYMRNNISAQSWASVPPEPACISRKALLSSISPENMRRNSSPSSNCRQGGKILFYIGDGAFVTLIRGQFQQFRGVSVAPVQSFNGIDDTFQRSAFAAQFLGAAGVVPNTGFSQFPVYLVEAVLAFSIVKDTP